MKYVECILNFTKRFIVVSKMQAGNIIITFGCMYRHMKSLVLVLTYLIKLVSYSKVESSIGVV